MSEDVLDCAFRIQQKDCEGKILVLNMASATRPGGGYLKGDTAQEESLMRRSNYFMGNQSVFVYFIHFTWRRHRSSLERRQRIVSIHCTWNVAPRCFVLIRKGHTGDLPLHYPSTLEKDWPNEYSVILTTNVSVFRKSEESVSTSMGTQRHHSSQGYEFMDEPVPMDFVAQAAYSLRSGAKFENTVPFFQRLFHDGDCRWCSILIAKFWASLLSRQWESMTTSFYLLWVVVPLRIRLMRYGAELVLASHYYSQIANLFVLAARQFHGYFKQVCLLAEC